jgi:hypothetical protein
VPVERGERDVDRAGQVLVFELVRLKDPVRPREWKTVTSRLAFGNGRVRWFRTTGQSSGEVSTGAPPELTVGVTRGSLL